MTTTPKQQESVQTLMARRRAPRAVSSWFYYIYCEILKALRDPFTIIFGIGFPTLFFVLFSGTSGVEYAPALMASYAAYGVFIVGFQNFSMAISSEREMGWNKLLRTTALSPVLYLTAKFIMIMLTGILSLALLFGVAALWGNVHMGLVLWAALFGVMLLGEVPFIFMGLFVGLVGSAGFTRAFAIVFGLVLSFGSGLFVPVQYLPEFIRSIAPYTPTYHLGQLGWHLVNLNADEQPFWLHLLWLAGYLLAFMVLCTWAYIRDEGRNYS